MAEQTRSSRYWSIRAEQRMDTAQAEGDKAMLEISQAYKDANAQIKGEIEKLQRAYMKRFDLTQAQAEAELAAPISGEEYWALVKRIQALPEGAQRRALEIKANARPKAYLISRWEATRLKLETELTGLAMRQSDATGAALRRAFGGAYTGGAGDIAQRAGVDIQFDGMSAEVIRQAVETRWNGANYSERVWQGMGALETALREVLRTGLTTGQGAEEMARQLDARMHAGLANARRLVRTELTYATNQAEVMSYKATGVTRYQFLATLDTRTSDICQSLDGEEFEVEQAQAGLNLPPMHPNCRSTTVARVDGSVALGLQRIARDKEGKYTYVPRATRYPAWFEAITGGKWEPSKTAQGILAKLGITKDVADGASSLEVGRAMAALKALLNPAKKDTAKIAASGKALAKSAGKLAEKTLSATGRPIKYTQVAAISVGAAPGARDHAFGSAERRAFLPVQTWQSPDVFPQYVPDEFPEYEPDTFPDDAPGSGTGGGGTLKDTVRLTNMNNIHGQKNSAADLNSAQDGYRIDDGTGFIIGRSLGAKARNYRILNPGDGGYYKFAENQKVQDAEVFAGYQGVKPLYEETINRLVKQYGGDPAKWQHSKGRARIVVGDEEIWAEVHWFQEYRGEKVEFIIKRWLE